MPHPLGEAGRALSRTPARVRATPGPRLKARSMSRPLDEAGRALSRTPLRAPLWTRAFDFLDFF